MNQPVIPKIAYKDFLINQKEPDRDSNKYIDFWEKHISYCKSGVEVGGVYISGWLYWHLNFFKVTQDEEDEWGNNLNVLESPQLRDNEWYIEHHIQKARELDNKPIIGFGTRRFGKSVFMTSRISYRTFIFQNSTSLIIGGSNPDLNNIVKYFNGYYQGRQDCFSDILKIGDWNRATSSDVQFNFSKTKVKKGGQGVNPLSYKWFPIKEKPAEDSFNFSYVATRNLEHGHVGSKEELLAGLTPQEGIWDEIGKFKYSKQRKALLPAITSKYGKRRFVEILMGTGGNIEYAEDAQEDFLYTEKSGFLHCDPEEYKKVVKPQYFQYTQNSNKKVGLFVPAQMSMEGGIKKEIPLYEYLNREFTTEQKKQLEGLNIWVTDWENAEKKVREHVQQEEAKKDEDGKKAKMYYPFQPEECFLDLNKNPFPVEEARKRQEFLKETGLTGEHIKLSIDNNGIIQVNPSDLPIIDKYPFKGGAQDAPVVIYERPVLPDPRQIKYGTYVAGFDGTKIDISNSTDSVNVLYIYKRKYGVSGFQDQIVASYAARPNIDTDCYYQCMLLLKLYNAELLPENDVNFTKYLRLHKADYLLANAKGVNLRINENSKASTNYGLPSNAGTKRHAIKLVKDYCHEEIEIGTDDHGIPIIVKGVHRINDYMLLEELIKAGNYENYDRIMSFGHALIWNEELSIHNVMPTPEQIQYQKQEYKTRNGSLGRNRKYAKRNPFRR